MRACAVALPPTLASASVLALVNASLVMVFWLPTNTSAAVALRYEYAASLVLKLLLNIKSNITASNINRVSLIHLVCRYRILGVTPSVL